MKSLPSLETSLFQKLCASLQEAYEAAAFEAANTGGVVLRVKSIRIEPNVLILAGLVPANALVSENCLEFARRLRPRSIGNLHFTASSQFQAKPADDIGYLVLQTPVMTCQVAPESEEADSCWVAVTIQCTLHNLKPTFIGVVCCALCNRPISQERLLAVPNTRLCTNCQLKKEKK